MSNSGAYRQHANATTRAHSKISISCLSPPSLGIARRALHRSVPHYSASQRICTARRSTPHGSAPLLLDPNRTARVRIARVPHCPVLPRSTPPRHAPHTALSCTPSALLSCTARNGALSRRHQPNIITHKLRPGYRNITQYLKRHMKEWGHARLNSKMALPLLRKFHKHLLYRPMVSGTGCHTELHFQHTLPPYTNNESPKGKHQNNRVHARQHIEEMYRCETAGKESGVASMLVQICLGGGGELTSKSTFFIRNWKSEHLF